MEKEERSYFYDLHCHTILSGHASSTLSQIVSRAKQRGLDGVAITDHDKIYQGESNIDGVDIIAGTEITTAEGFHLLGYFVKKRIEKGISFEKAITEIKKQGGIAVWAHPLRGRKGFGEQEEIFFSLLDGMEAGNAMDESSEREEVLKKCENFSLLKTAGSDTHADRQVGTAVLKVSGKIKRENFYEKVLSGEIIIKNEIEDFRKNNRKHRIILRKFKKRDNLLLKSFYSKIILRNYFRLQNIFLRKINFSYKEKKSL